ncbi:hypothetical protein DFH09DRAFT_1314744 [Mycena vulgaris]|nr:hypothetical protein DFH09DRAFT_1314744 [Mycena vulgaris]
MVPGEPSTGPKTRQKEHLKSARAALERWHINTYLGSYSNCVFMYDSLLPNTFLTSLASHRTATLEALAELVPAWAFVEEHGADVLRVLTRIDDAERAEREREKEAKKVARHAETAARRAERAHANTASPEFREHASASYSARSFLPPDLFGRLLIAD